MSDREQGFTLVELILVVAVGGILIVFIGNYASSGLQSYQYIKAQSDTSVDLTNLIDRSSRVIRGATQLLDAQSNTMTIYAYFSPADAVVNKVRYFVSGSLLQVGVTPPSGTAPNYTYSSANEKITTLATNLVTTTPVFTYYDDLAAQLTGSFTVNQVKQVGITVTANPNPARLPIPLQVQTRVTLRNMKTNL